MNEKKAYIVEIPQVLGDETTSYPETNGYPVKSPFAIVGISDSSASIMDNCYRTIGEAQSAWPEAIAPRPYHLTTSAIKQGCTIDSEIPNRKLKS